MPTRYFWSKGLLELKRLHKVRDRQLPMAHGLGWADELEEVIPFRSFNHSGVQTIIGVVMCGAAAGRHLRRISPRDIDARHLQTINRARFSLRFVLRSAAIRLLYLRDPTIDIRLYRAALSRAKVINHQQSIFRITVSPGQLVLRDAHARCSLFLHPTIGRLIVQLT